MKRGKCELGQSLVEFAFVLPAFLMITFGILDVGRAVVSYTVLANSAREGAREGIAPKTADANIRTAVRSQASVLGTIPDSSIAISPSLDARESDATIAVTVTYSFQPVTPLISNVIGTSMTLSATSRMVIE